MAKNALKFIAGTVAQAVVGIGGVVIVIGSLPVPGGHGTRHHIGRELPKIINEIGKWKNE
jgi:hypothetical protein